MSTNSKYDRQQACRDTFKCSAEVDSSTNWSNIGLFRYDMDACETPEHTPQEHAIVVVHQPLEVERRLGGELRQELIYPDRNVIINPAGVPQSGKWDAPASFSMIFLDPKIIAHAFQDAIDPDEVEILPHFSQTDPFINAVAKSLESALDPSQWSRLFAESTAITLGLHLLLNYATKKIQLPADSKSSGDFLTHDEYKRMTEYLRVNLHEDLSLLSMARLTNKSSSYFARCFQGSFGESLYEYVKNMRLLRGSEILKEQPSLSVEDVAKKIGLSSSNFRKYFRLKFGVSPTVFRNL